jgi:hypothetical protein
MTETWFKKQLKLAIIIFFVTNIIGVTCTGFIFYGSASSKIETHEKNIGELREDIKNKASIPMVMQVKNDLKEDMKEIKADIKELLKRK